MTDIKERMELAREIDLLRAENQRLKAGESRAIALLARLFASVLQHAPPVLATAIILDARLPAEPQTERGT